MEVYCDFFCGNVENVDVHVCMYMFVGMYKICVRMTKSRLLLVQLMLAC